MRQDFRVDAGTLDVRERVERAERQLAAEPRYLGQAFDDEVAPLLELGEHPVDFRARAGQGVEAGALAEG